MAPTLMAKVCPGCGEEFTTTLRHQTKYCSRRCGGKARRIPDREAHFWAGVDRGGGEESCWPWTRGCFDSGYGDFGGERAHRVAYTYAYGPISKGRHVLHGCDNPPCCNPRHLRAGTQVENARDCVERGRSTNWGRHNNYARGERHGRAKLTDAQVAELRATPGTLREVARKFGIGPTQVARLRKGEQR